MRIIIILEFCGAADPAAAARVERNFRHTVRGRRLEADLADSIRFPPGFGRVGMLGRGAGDLFPVLQRYSAGSVRCHSLMGIPVCGMWRKSFSEKKLFR